MHLEILFEQILILSVLILAGVIASRAGVITNEGKDILSKVIFNITLPLLLFTNFSLLDFNRVLLHNTFISMGLATLSMLFALLTAWVSARIFKIEGSEGSVFRAQVVFGNIVFLGYPLVYSLYGQEGLLYASAFQLSSNILLYSVGVMLITQGKGYSVRRSLGQVINPNTIAIVAGFLLFITSLKLPVFLEKSLSGLGGTTIYLSMVYVGAMMYFSKIRGLLLRRSIYLLSFLKLILIPVLLSIFFITVNRFAGGIFDPIVLSVVILETGMPAMTLIIILAKIYGGDEKMATANVFVSTLFSLISIPGILYLLGKIM